MSIINIILSYGFLTTLEGDNRLLGIPFATVAVTWISTIVVMYKSLNTLESTLSETYHWKKMVTIAIVSIISAAPIVGLLSLDLENKIFLISSILLYGTIFLFTSFKFKILNNTEIDLIKSFLSFKI